MNDTVEQIKDLAEDYIRTGGYSSFSFRDIAREVGIKSASVHYHFPTKSDLGVGVARRYIDFFTETLGNPEVGQPDELIRDYILLYYQSMIHSDKMCLCTVLSVERETLTEELREEVRAFFELNLGWLGRVSARHLNKKHTSAAATQMASLILSTLQGAMIGSRALENLDYFKSASRSLYSSLFNKNIRFI
ncbi:TetR/AcrR family transcriptional regulator [Hahella ganghwensis]|uniref:TetR/AcrR family transcriptional regulator n=1 Tax=Hahella ganghwensis TaxID=286420 RepID=UPI000367535E|nr:TetR/AcrR family transcriptional regulator [Hahella ganghwensis]